MLSVAFPVFYFHVIVLLNQITCSSSQIQCKHCVLQSHAGLFIERLFEVFKNLQNSTLCVWSNRWQDNGIFDLPKRFAQRYKTVVSVGGLPVESIPEVCLHNVILPGRRDCSGLLSPTLPLSVLHHFYTLVEADMTQAAVDQCSAQFGYARAVLVSLAEKRVFSLSSPFTRPRHFLPSELDANLEKINVRRENVKGTELNVATFHCPPFVMFEHGNYTGWDDVTGNEWEIVKTLSNQYNLTMNLAKLEGDQEWGTIINGTANGGIIEALVVGEADIGVCNIWNVLSKYDIMDFGPIMNEVTFTYIVPRPHLIPHQWQSLITIFTTRMWLYTLVTFVMSTFCYWLFCNLSPNQSCVSPAESIMTMFGMLMLTSWTAKPLSSSCRQLVTWWSLLTLMLTALYSSSIAARLTLPKYESRIDTVRQLVEHGFHWYDPFYPESDKWSIYFNPTNYWQSQLKRRFQRLTRAQVLPALLSRQFAFPIQKWGGLFMYFNAEGLNYETDLDDMRVMRETTDATYVSIGFAKRSPFLHVFQGPLMWMYQAGLPTHWTSHVVRTKVDSYNKRLLRDTDDVNTQQLRTLAMDSLLPAFCILAFGLLSGTIIFLAEIWYDMHQRRSTNRIYPFAL